MPVIDAKRLIENRVEAIKNYHTSCNIKKAELDLSGGIDSAVMACLLTLALGKENIILVHSKINTNPEQTKRAVNLASALDIHLINLDITNEYDAIVNKIIDTLGEEKILEVQERIKNDPTVLGSFRSCLRAPIGRACNRMLGGGIRHGTGNECEDRFLRFYQKGGDSEVDTNPIEMLSKTEVYQLAFALGELFGGKVQETLKETIKAIPSADLWGVGDKHNDESEIKHMTGADFTYGRIDPETGKILNFGTIELISRLSDKYHLYIESKIEAEIFPYYTYCLIQDVVDMCPDLYNIIDKESIIELVKAAIKIEKNTRHKCNLNIPTLGTRQELLDKKILTNKLEIL